MYTERAYRFHYPNWANRGGEHASFKPLRRRTVGAMHVNFLGETKEIRVLAPKWDAGTNTYETNGSWDAVTARPRERLIFRDKSVYEILHVEASGFNRTELILTPIPRTKTAR